MMIAKGGRRDAPSTVTPKVIRADARVMAESRGSTAEGARPKEQGIDDCSLGEGSDERMGVISVAERRAWGETSRWV